VVYYIGGGKSMLRLVFEILIYLFLIFILLFNVKLKALGDEFISRNETNSLKGISIIIICLYHYLVNLDKPGLLFILANVGYLGVVIFMFLSGYGIAKSYKTKGFYKFISKRIEKVYLPFLAVNIFTIVLYFLFAKERFSVIDLIKYIIGIKLIDDVLWYVIAILIFYFIFYVTYKYFSLKTATILLLAFSIVYPIICFLFGIGMRWYTTSFSFFIGVSIALYKEIYDNLFQKKYYLFLSIFSFLFLVLTFGSYYFNSIGCLKIWLCYFSNIAFNFIIILLLYRIRFGNAILLFLGVISYWMYLVHMKIYNIIFLKNSSHFSSKGRL
jgi:membrane-bound acyltransferase YfiQ involved in biofilm formation